MKTNLLGERVIDNFRDEYWFLSNFYPATQRLVLRFDDSDCVFFCPTAEHAYQAMKADNLQEAGAIAAARTPENAKKMGRTVTLRKDWEDKKLAAMYTALNGKFLSNEKLAKRLIETGDATLIEGNTWGDTFWGVCDGKGANHLGILLMDIRDYLTKVPR